MSQPLAIYFGGDEDKLMVSAADVENGGITAEEWSMRLIQEQIEPNKGE